MPGPAPNTSVHPEIERKFDVDASAVSPSFEGIAAVARVEIPAAQTLQTEYFDTASYDLATRRITLRRRTGDTQPGWQLKLPAGPNARSEVRAPLETDAAPLREIVLAIVRDRPLVSVTQVTTARHRNLFYDAGGEVIAEFCDDRVTATTSGDDDVQDWREWELELAGAGGELLDQLANRLLDAGAKPAEHGSKLARALDIPEDAGVAAADSIRHAVAEQVEALLVWDRAVRDDADDAVHQLRVTTRKIRSLLQAAAETFGLADDPWVLDELRELAAVLGVARDAEVLAGRYRSALDALAPELVRGRARQRLVDAALERYRTGWRRSLTALRSQRYFRLLDALDGLVAGEPPRQTDAPATVDAAYRKVRKAAKAAARSSDDDDDALHRIRKGTKRLRYTAAAMGATKVAKRAKSVQTLLGDHQDSVVSRAHLLRRADAAAAAGEDTFTYGLLYQREDDLARGCRSGLADALRALDEAVRQTRLKKDRSPKSLSSAGSG